MWLHPMMSLDGPITVMETKVLYYKEKVLKWMTQLIEDDIPSVVCFILCGVDTVC